MADPGDALLGQIEQLNRYGVDNVSPVGEYFNADDVLALCRSWQDAQGWRPIETAPKDGTVVLVFTEGCVWLAAWQSEWWEESTSERSGMSIRPLVWMPLPAPPIVAAPTGTESEQ